MLNFRKNLSLLATSSFAATALTLGMATPASSQLLPEVWGALGARDNDFSYAEVLNGLVLPSKSVLVKKAQQEEIF